MDKHTDRQTDISTYRKRRPRGPMLWKLDKVGPVDNRPSTDKLYHFNWKKVTHDTWQVTHDMWHMTHETWHVTCDIWHVTCGGWTFSHNFSSLALTVFELWYFEDLEKKADWLTDSVTESIKNKAVYRKAPATPGQLRKIY